jgi:phenylacetate-CoA ligase
MIYNRLLEGLVLPVGDLIFGSCYISSLKMARKEILLDNESLRELQMLRLRSIINYAREHSDYYSKIIPKHEIKDVYEFIKGVPFLTKDTIRNKGNELLTTSKNNLIKMSSSGSTGVQTEVYLSKSELSIDRAIQTLWWEWAGYKIGMPMLQTGLAINRSFEKRLKDFVFRTKYVFAFGLEREKLLSYKNWIRFNKPFLGGYASSLFVLSELLGNEKCKFHSAVSWGDKLFDNYKRSINSAFECKVYETYGAGEGFKIAAQFDLNYLYIMSPYVYIEIVDEHGNIVPDGELGSIVVTSLINKSMPLIRYKIGDLAIKLPSDLYPKESILSLPLLQKVIGRETDIVRTPSGKKLIVHSFTGIFEFYSDIKQFCIIQEHVGGVIVEYINDGQLETHTLSEIKNKLIALIGEPFEIIFHRVDNIPATPSGKPQIIISRLK